jgi:N-acetyltransferase
METFELQPILTGSLLRLRPLLEEDFDELYACASDPEIWKLHPRPNRYQRDVFLKFFEDAMASMGALAVIDSATGKMIGSSRFYHLDPAAKHVTIGYTFLTRTYWGGKYNLELKALMLGHALRFVEAALFEVGAQNYRSRRAMEKIGGELIWEGVLDGMPYVNYQIDRKRFAEFFASSAQ